MLRSADVQGGCRVGEGHPPGLATQSAPEETPDAECNRRRRDSEDYLPAACFEQRHARRERNARANEEQADHAKPKADRDDGHPPAESKGSRRDDRTNREEQEGGNRGLPG